MSKSLIITANPSQTTFNYGTDIRTIIQNWSFDYEVWEGQVRLDSGRINGSTLLKHPNDDPEQGDNQYSLYDSSGNEITGYLLNSEGRCSVNVTLFVNYGGQTIYANNTTYIDVSRTVTSIRLSNFNTKFIKNIEVGSQLGAVYSRGASAKVYATFSDSQQEVDVTSSCVFTNEPSYSQVIYENTSYQITFRNITQTVNIKLYDYRVESDIQSITIENIPTLFNKGDYLSYGDNVLKITFKDSVGYIERPIEGNVTFSPAIGTRLTDTTTYNVSYTYLTFRNNYNVVIKYLDSLSLSLTGVKKNYYQYDTLDTTNFVCYAVYSYSDRREDTQEQVNCSLSLDGEGIEQNSRLSVYGDKTLVAYYTNSYGDYAINDEDYDITITQLQVSKIEITHNYLENNVAGEKLFYKNETGITKHDKTKLEITATFNNNTTAILEKEDYTISPAVGSKFDSIGEETITISYGEKTTSYNVSVINDSVSSLSVSGAKTNYNVGDKFVLTNVSCKVVYASGKRVQIGYGVDGYDVKINNVSVIPNVTTFSMSDRVGTQTLVFTYSGISSTGISLTINMPIISSLYVDSSALGTTFKNNDSTAIFDITNLIVKIIYQNNYQETLTYQSGDPLANNFQPIAGKWYANLGGLVLNGTTINEPTTPITRNLTIVGYSSDNTGITAQSTLGITVQPNNQLENIVIKTDNAKLVYSSGETFTGEGFVIVATYSEVSGVSEIPVVMGNSSIYTINPSLGTTLYKVGKQTITFYYSYLNVTKSATASITVNPSYQTTTSTKVRLKVVKVDELIYNEDEIVDVNSDGKIWALYEDNDTSINVSGVRILSNPSAKCYGYIKEGTQTADTGITKENAKLVLFDDYTPPIEGASNITVKFPHYVEGYADRINHCRFGILFGANNYRNRLFVSGNPDKNMGNMDWHSCEVNVSQVENYEGLLDGDFTYFSDRDYNAYGQLSNKVVGYGVVGNGTLMVLKSNSSQEPTIYYRTPTEIDATAYDGSSVVDINGNVLKTIAYTTTQGNIGEGGLNNNAVINFNGDSVFLTRTGLKGLDIVSAVADNQRYANPRSTLINKLLLSYDLTKCSLYTYKDYLLLQTTGRLFIANTNYRTNNEYEWWILDNVKGDYFTPIDDLLYFTNKDGKLYKLDFNIQEYIDKQRTFVSSGGLLPVNNPIEINENNEKIIFNSAYSSKVVDGNILNIFSNYSTLTTDQRQQQSYHKKIYGYMGVFYTQAKINSTPGVTEKDVEGIIQTTGNKIKINDIGNDVVINSGLPTQTTITRTEYTALSFRDGREVYLDHLSFVANSGLVESSYLGKKYKIKRDDNFVTNYMFQLLDEEGNVLDLTNIDIIRISFIVEDAIMYECVYTPNTNCKIKEKDGKPIDIITYDYQAIQNFSGVITEEENVVAYYITKPYDLDSMGYYKNVFSWTIVNDTQTISYQDLGYFIDNTSRFIIKAESGSSEFNLQNFDFETFTFTTNCMPTFRNTHRTLEDVQFISFIFKNEGNANMVVTNISIEYTIGKAIDD